MSTPKTIIAFGELLWDIFASGEVLGGAPANFAYRINSLGHDGWPVTRLGKDDRGQRAADLIRKNGLPLQYVQWDDAKPTGTVPVEVDAAGVPGFTIVRNVAYDYIEPTEPLLALAAAAQCICFGSLIQRSDISRRTLYSLLDAAPHALKVLDLNLRKDCYNRDIISESIRRAHILKLNEDEAGLVAGMFSLPNTLNDFARFVVEDMKRLACIITLGANGIIATNNKGEFIHRPGHKVNVVDTVGCGDAVTAGFVHCYLEGRPLPHCCDFANALGALVAQARGGTAPIKFADIEALAGTAA
jgi:fructokinase